MKHLKQITSFYHEQDSFVFWPVSLSIFLSLLVALTWAISYVRLPKQLPIFYSLAWGDAQFGHINQFILFPCLITLTILINLTISWHLHFSQILIKRVLAIASLIISLLLSIAGFKIVFTFI